MRINDCVKMTMFLSLAYFSFDAKCETFVEIALSHTCIFAFYREIQIGCQNWWENDFFQKSADAAFHCNRSILHISQINYAENQDSHQKWWEKRFLVISRPKTLEIHWTSKILPFLHFTQKFKIPPKWQENDFWQNSPDDCG